MPFGQELADDDVLRGVVQRMTHFWGDLQQRIDVRVCDGVVSIVGTIDHELQREPIITMTRGVPGVRGIIDVMSVTASDDSGGSCQTQ